MAFKLFNSRPWWRLGWLPFPSFFLSFLSFLLGISPPFPGQPFLGVYFPPLSRTWAYSSTLLPEAFLL